MKIQWSSEPMRILSLVFLVIVVFGQTLTFQFLNYDDPLYVGLISDLQFESLLERLSWAFTYTETGDWQPLVWLSWMLDNQIFGMNPLGYHFVNVLLHVFVVLLIYQLLACSTGAKWRSFLVAVFFAIHPMRVESVAWVAERKDLLSAFWMIVTMLAYVRYTQVIQKGSTLTGLFWYGLTFCAFALGLMSKPMLVTLPLLLLLLDYWPLKRLSAPFSIKKVTKCVFEKVPLAILVLISIVLTMSAIEQIKEFLYFGAEPFSERIESTLVAYGDYFYKLFWPDGLTFFYWKLDGMQPTWVFASVAMLITVSVFCVVQFKKKPYLIVGWLWFLIILIPVGGWVARGTAAWKADRYTYFGHIGLLVGVVWLLSDWLKPYAEKHKKRIVLVLMGLTMIYSFSAIIYCAQWKDSETLNKYAIRIAPDNYRAYNNLGSVYLKQKKYGRALELFEKSLEVNPAFKKAYRNIGQVHFHLKNWDEAFENFQMSAKLMPDDVMTHFALGQIYADRNQLNQAIAHLEVGLKFESNPAVGVYRTLAKLWRKKGDLEKSITYYHKALELLPNDDSVHNNLANVYYMNKDMENAKKHFIRTLEINPGHDNANKVLKLMDDENQ